MLCVHCTLIGVSSYLCYVCSYHPCLLGTMTACDMLCLTVASVRYGWHSTFDLRHSVAPCFLLTDLRKANYLTCTPLLNLNHIGSAHLPFYLQEEPILYQVM